MATRTFTLSNTLVNGSDLLQVGVPITATLIVPGGVPAVDTDAKAVIPDPMPLTTDNTGSYTYTLIYTGDITPAGCVWQIVENGTTVLSPVDFAYETSLATWQWYPNGGPAGTLGCRFNLVLGNDSPVSGRYVHVTPQQNTVAPDGTVLSTYTSVDAILDGTGRAIFWLWPSSVLTPTTNYSLRIDGETTRISFTVPGTPTGYQGAYNSGTAYYVHNGSAYEGPYTPGDTPPDVVLYNGLQYVCIADTTGNLPTDTTYWMPWLGENILWHIVPFGVTQTGLPMPSANVAHTSAIVPITGAPVASPATLADDLANLQFDALHGPMQALYAAANFT